jgi:hypothetical protein
MRIHARQGRGGERHRPAGPEEGHEREPFVPVLVGDPADPSGLTGFDRDDAADDDTDEAGEPAGGSAGRVPDDSAYDDARRVRCPECARPTAVLAGSEVLPVHARCDRPWDPFGLTVCSGSGRPAAEAPPELPVAVEAEWAVTDLPAGLDWRTQPFSHAFDAAARPVPAPLVPYGRAA